MRIESDLLGNIEIDNSALWGINTERAINNFGYKTAILPIDIIIAISEIKKVAAKVNRSLKFLGTDISDNIISAANNIIDRKYDNQFILSAYQGGAGTSTNMNINEVIANIANLSMGREIGDYSNIDPIAHVNLHQSTNDVFPTALRIAIIRKLRILSEIVAKAQGACQSKEQEFTNILTIGRTELQDAVPMTLGAQFASFAQPFERDRWRCFKAEERVRVVNIGGTAIGTGLTAPRDYIFRIIEALREETGLPLSRAEHLIDATANQDSLVEVSAILLTNATNLIKISKDLRQLHFLNEITLQKLQAGSSIMPGKVNPVALESIISMALRVKTNNSLIADSISDGTLQINEFMPLIGYTIIESMNLLIEANNQMAKTVSNITANREICLQKFENSPMLITAFIPYIGYKKGEELIKKFKNINKPFREFLIDELGEEIVTKKLKPSSLTALGFR